MGKPKMELRTVYDVTYVNAHGEQKLTADFSLAQAQQMAGTLYNPEIWPGVTSVTITRAERLVDVRTVQEIEEGVAA